MNRLKFVILLVLISVLSTGCQIFPYVFEPATETPTTPPTLTATTQPTHTAVPFTPTPQDTPTPENTPEEPTAEPTPETVLQYFIQEGSPFYMPNFAQPSAGCDWMGVAGQVFDEQNHEVQDLLVVIGNAPDEGDEEWNALTGTTPAYGPGGYEIQLADAPFESSQVFWIEIRAQDGTILSERFLFDTYEDCERNLILINFDSNQ